MAARLAGGSDYGFKFETVQLFKNQTLGTGSYGAVCKAKCDELPCAAKLLYPVLFDLNIPSQATPPNGKDAKEHRQPMRRFEAECRFLSQIKHPNIIQYIGTYHDPETNAPVLLMELMDESLTHFLETAQNPVLYHIQLNILHDTALALAFLHTNGITHRDLSSNNVLLIAGSRTKVTDFGMSKFADAAAPHLASITQCPGTPAYMSPEALDEPPVYSEKLDCFSFGVLIVQVITREFPKPTDRFKIMEVVNPSQPSRRFQARVAVPELERRQSHINLIPAAHHLQPIVLDCLKDSDVERPTAQQLCESLEQLKTTPLYASSIRLIRDRDLLIQTQRQTIQDKEKQLQDQRQTIQQLQRQETQLQIVEQEVAQLSQEVQTKTQVIQQLRRQNGQLSTQQQLQQEVQQLKQQVQSSEELVAEFQQGMTDKKDRQIEQLQTQLQRLELKSDQQPEVGKKTAWKVLKLSWRKGPKAPTTMSRGSSTIVGNAVYINPFGSPDVYAFHCNTLQWSTLPQCPYIDSTLTTIDNKLTAVGGSDPNSLYTPTNKVITHCDQKWVELYPPMLTERCWAAVLSTTTHVVVIGGMGWLNTTEVLNIGTKQWSTASPLPYGIGLATTTLCGETLYLMGGYTDSNSDYSVISCQLRDLLEQSTLSIQRQPSSSTATLSKVWQNIPDLPVEYSTCATIQGHVLAIGGIDKLGKSSSIIYRYVQQRNEWIVVNNNMMIARSSCLATVLPDNDLLVVGGYNDSGNKTEISTIA